MPTYVYRCPNCESEWEGYNCIANRYDGGDCADCGTEGELTVGMFNNGAFRARWFEGIDSQPVYVESQSQLNAICKKNNCEIIKDDRKKQKRYYEKHDMVEEGKRVCK
jgi:hypothetical protein